MDTQKLTVILLILVIVFAAITIVMNFSADAPAIDQTPNIIINDPDDSSVGHVGLGVSAAADDVGWTG